MGFLCAFSGSTFWGLALCELFHPWTAYFGTFIWSLCGHPSVLCVATLWRLYWQEGDDSTPYQFPCLCQFVTLTLPALACSTFDFMSGLERLMQCLHSVLGWPVRMTSRRLRRLDWRSGHGHLNALFAACRYSWSWWRWLSRSCRFSLWLANWGWYYAYYCFMG